VHHQGKYDLLQRDYGADHTETEPKAAPKPEKIPESKLAQGVQRLMELIFDTTMMSKTMIEIGYDGKEMGIYCVVTMT
jgi:acyl-CoA thioesterase